MGNSALAPAWVSSAIYRVWNDGIADAVPTLYPGLRGDTSLWTEWYELWVDHWSPRRQRAQAPELCDLRVTVHAFVKAAPSKARISELIEQARSLLTGQTISIPDPETSDAVLGYIRLGDAQVKELTRSDADASRHGLQHHVAFWDGLAQRMT